MTMELTTLKEQVTTEHHRAELERLEAGQDGCGCWDCQGLYRAIDLEKYGDRVRRTPGAIVIAAGRTGAILWEKYNQPDFWAPDGSFVTGGKRYIVSATGSTVCTGDYSFTAPVTVRGVKKHMAVVGDRVFIGGTDRHNLLKAVHDRKMTPYQAAKEMARDGIKISPRAFDRAVIRYAELLKDDIRAAS